MPNVWLRPAAEADLLDIWVYGVWGRGGRFGGRGYTKEGWEGKEREGWKVGRFFDRVRRGKRSFGQGVEERRRKMGKEKKTENKHGKFVLRRGEKAESFVCERCGERKTAKIQVEWTDMEGERKVLCNGCYGWLHSPAGS